LKKLQFYIVKQMTRSIGYLSYSTYSQTLKM